MTHSETAEAWQVSTVAAEVYEQDFVPAVFADWAPRIAEAAGLAPGQKVLDVACGTGVLARAAADRVAPGGAVTGLDLNDGMLAVAGRLRPEIAWRQGDAEALPFEAGAFDAVVSQFGLMFFADREAALREMWRVLAPGGRLAVAVWASLERHPVFAALVAILRRYVGEAAVALEAPFALGEPAPLRALFRAAGVEAPRLETRRGAARFGSLEDYLRIEIEGTPLAERVDEAAYRDILTDARRELAGLGAPGDGFRFPMEAQVVVATKL